MYKNILKHLFDFFAALLGILLLSPLLLLVKKQWFSIPKIIVAISFFEILKSQIFQFLKHLNTMIA